MGTRPNLEIICREYLGCIREAILDAGVPLADVEEVVPQALVAIGESLATYDPTLSKLSTWVFAVARNTAARALRDRYAPERRFTAIEPVLLTIPEPSPNSEERLIAHEEERLLREAMAQLPYEWRVTFELRALQEKGWDDVAKSTGVPRSTARTRYDEACKHLREAITRHRKQQKFRTGAVLFPVSVETLLARERAQFQDAPAAEPRETWRRVLSALTAHERDPLDGSDHRDDVDTLPPSKHVPGDAVRALPAWTRRSRGEPLPRRPLRRALRSRLATFLGGIALGGAIVWFLVRPQQPLPLGPDHGDPMTVVVGTVSSEAPSFPTLAPPSAMAPMLGPNPSGVPSAWLASPLVPLPLAADSATRAASPLPPSSTSGAQVEPEALPQSAGNGEAYLLTQAQHAIGRGDFNTARELLDRHAHDFPSGRLKDEQKALRARLSR